jgi:hypothetical protein
MSQSELSPGGITWEVAMFRASEILSSLPTDPKSWGKTFGGIHPDVIGARVSVAQAWIGFARELTSHGRAPSSHSPD